MSKISEALLKIRFEGRYRRVSERGVGVDFSSNDYLGLSRVLADHIRQRGCEIVSEFTELGATGSRLISGTTNHHISLEVELADTFKGEAALLFGSGYEANLGVLSCVASREDTIVFDQLVHASMRDGIRLSQARSYSFRHNDVESLRKKVSQAKGTVYIAVESVYSMDGDEAPLVEICRVAREFGAKIIVDEAHSTGLYGAQGSGLVCERGLEGEVFARIHTFGKAVGYKGACVVGNSELREYLINFSRPFIYSTAPDLLSVSVLKEALALVRHAEDRRLALRRNIAFWRTLVAGSEAGGVLESASPIQGVIVPGNERVTNLERSLVGDGFEVKAIRAPTVPEGAERIRVCLHSYNTEYEMQTLWKGLLAERNDYVERV